MIVQSLAKKFAKALGAKVVGLLGFDGGRVKELADVCVVVPSRNYQYVRPSLGLESLDCRFVKAPLDR